MTNVHPETRRFLEGMMIRFTSIGVPVPQAADELVEIEAHITRSTLNPFDELGDPQDLAASLISKEQREFLFRRKLRQDITGGIMFAVTACAGLQFALSLAGRAETSIPRILLFFVFACLFGVGQLAFSTILMGASDDDYCSMRVRGAARVCFWAFFAMLLLVAALALAGADFSGSEPFVLATAVWLVIFLVVAVISLFSAWRAWRLRDRRQALIEGGVTGQILYEMNNNSNWEGWVQYGHDGADLRDYDSTLRMIRDAWNQGKLNH